MTALDQALSFASRGFWVFPVKANGNTPVHVGWQAKATRDETKIRRWWGLHPDYNVGIFTGRFGEDQALCVVDIDEKHGKHGGQTLIKLELSGADFPVTLEHATPNQGRHLIYVTDQPLKGGADVLGPGLDIRSRGQYIVAPGSEIDGRPYTQINGHGTLHGVPGWLRGRLGADLHPAPVSRAPLPGVDPNRASHRALGFLKAAPLAVEGQHGDTTTYKVAAQLKDFGCSEAEALFLMDSWWNDRCTPPWDPDELRKKVAHAYRYGRDPQGAAAPEAVFPAVEEDPEDEAPAHPVDKLNQQFAFTPAGGGHIIWETTDPKGANVVRHLDLATFHTMHASQKLTMGKTRVPITKLWLESKNRRSYDGFVFAPCQDRGPRWYNLWRGFATTPATSAEHPAVAAFLEHAKLNVCNGDPGLFRWLMGFFAHMIQRPWEKPLVSLVFKGMKGTGKNALVERVGALLGGHFTLTAKRRYLVGQFNGHLENCLCLTLDEAFWSGDKEAEGVLKDLITGTEHLIEHKGKEAYKVANLTRVVIIGNEDWLVPASHDERRYAVFTLGEGRIRDKAFFEAMRVGMEQGGYAHLLRYLLDFDLTGIDVNEAPMTQGLVDQKVASLDPTAQWWLECLSTGQVAGGDFGGEWPADIASNRLRDSLERWARKQHITSRMPNEVHFGRRLKLMAPSFRKHRTGEAKRQPGDTSNHFHSPGLEQLRQDFDHFIGGKIEWNPL